MAKKFIRKIMPNHETIRDHKYLKMFGTLLHDPNLWHLNRRSVSGAFAIGLFFAWVPVPFQMIMAAAVAIPMRMNLPLSVVLVWVTNPLTMPPMFWAAYQVGALMLGESATKAIDFEVSWEWLSTTMSIIWQPFLLGCFILGVISSILGYVFIRFLWRWGVVKEWNARKFKRRLKKAQEKAQMKND